MKVFFLYDIGIFRYVNLFRAAMLLAISSIQNWYDAFLNYLYKSLHMSTYVFTSQECAEIGGGERDRYLSWGDGLADLQSQLFTFGFFGFTVFFNSNGLDGNETGGIGR